MICNLPEDISTECPPAEVPPHPEDDDDAAAAAEVPPPQVLEGAPVVERLGSAGGLDH